MITAIGQFLGAMGFLFLGLGVYITGVLVFEWEDSFGRSELIRVVLRLVLAAIVLFVLAYPFLWWGHLYM